MSAFPTGPMGAFGSTVPYRSREEEITVGKFFNTVYAWMSVGLATTAVVAYSVYTFAPGLISMGVLIVTFIAQLALVFAISGAINKINTNVATVLFVLYAALMGITMSVVFAIYTRSSLAAVFLETSAMFGAMSVFGFFTKTDLTKFGSLLFMALIGLIVASVVNFFVASSTLYWIVSYAGVAIFVGLTAFDTQKLKYFAMQNANNPALANRIAIVGSLSLYLDFINIFMFLLRIMGDRQR